MMSCMITPVSVTSVTFSKCYKSNLEAYSNITQFFENLSLPKYNRKCYRGYKQTFILLKIHTEMVENNTF